jgi:photosystem II stability/assembly factor-like uncharacterized protein
MKVSSNTCISALIFLVVSIHPLEAKWEKINGLGGGARHFLISGDTAFICNDSGVFLSKISDPLGTVVPAGLQGILVHYLLSANGSIFAAANGAIYRFTDGGDSWKALTFLNGLPLNADILSLAVKDSVIFSLSGAGIYRSTNNGESWLPANNGLFADQVSSLGVCNGIIFVGDKNGVARSTDNGKTWHYIESGISGTPVGFTAVNDTIFTATSRGVFRFSNGSERWICVNSGLKDTTILSLCAKGRSLFIGTKFDGVFRSTDHGLSWVGAGLSKSAVGCLVAKGDTLFASTWDAGVFLSTDEGVTWKSVNYGNPLASIGSIGFGDGAVFATTGGAIFRSTDNCASWSAAAFGYDLVGRPLAIRGDTIFAGSGSSRLFGVLRSIDNGVTWKAINSGLPDATVADIAFGGDYIFAGLAQGVFRSSDNGETWKEVNSGFKNPPIVGVNCLLADGATLFAGTNWGLYRSTDYGVSWIQPTDSVLSRRSFYTMAKKGSTLYAILDHNAVFRSNDNGNTWTGINTPPYILYSILINGNAILIASEAGMRRSIDDGASWSRINIGGTYPKVLSMAVHDSMVYVGTLMDGFWRIPLSEISDTSSAGLTDKAIARQVDGELRVSMEPNARISIRFLLSHSESINANLYDLTGKFVRSFFTARLAPALYRYLYDIRDISPGCYLLKIKMGAEVHTTGVSVLR